MRPLPVGKAFVARPWGGDFGEYASFHGTRIPAFGEAWRACCLRPIESLPDAAEKHGTLVHTGDCETE